MNPNRTEDQQLSYEELQERLASLTREHQALNDRYMRLLTERRKDSDRTHSAARRKYYEDLLRAIERDQVRYVVERALVPVTGLIYRVHSLGERCSQKKVAELKAAATQADSWLRDARSASNPDQQFAEEAAAEIARLRRYIREAGQRLHTTYAQDTAHGCECPGCLLIVDMDLVPDGREDTEKGAA